jgi:predicted esterase
MSSSSSNPRLRSPPLIIPVQQTHKTTLIILHGRGSTAEKFAEPLLNHAVSAPAAGKPISSPSLTFKDHFPNTKFVFPTAPLRRALVFNRSLTHQWLDNWSLTQPEVKQYLQAQGLRETSVFLHGLFEQEIEIVGAKNVVIMGLSQGCAASIVAALLWTGEPLGAVVGICGYLPFRKSMKEVVDGTEDEGAESDEEGLFERHKEGSGSETKFEKAVGWLREELGMTHDLIKDCDTSAVQLMPVFMGHGTEDNKVPCELGKLAADFLEGVDVGVTWKEYDGLDHWYSVDMLGDVVEFLKGLEGWESHS